MRTLEGERPTSRTRPTPGRADTGSVKRLRGPGGISVEQVEYVDRAGFRRRVLWLRQYERHLGGYSSVEALSKVIDVGELVEDEDPGQAAAKPSWCWRGQRRPMRAGGAS